MFTGLVDDIGRILRITDSSVGREVHVQCGYRDLAEGESIAVNGACLTVRTFGESSEGTWFSTAAVTTTLERTTIGAWRVHDRVNLERALRLGDRLGGHLVQGHVDGVAVVLRTEQHGDAWLIDLSLPVALQPLMVLHGSVAVNGVSLTVNALLDDGIQLSIIDYTQHRTTLGDLVPTDRVHVEADMLAKHVERLLAPQLTRVGAA